MIPAVNSYQNKFPMRGSAQKTDANKNPISVAGERATLLKGTALAGLGLGGRLLWEIIIDGDFFFEDISKVSKKLIDKNRKGVSGAKKQLLYAAGFTALVGCFVGGVAILYSIFNAPKVMYQGKVNAFTKGKDMNVYIKGNEVETELYNQMNDKAKNATDEKKKILAQQYLKLKAAKNEVPDSVKK